MQTASKSFAGQLMAAPRMMKFAVTTALAAGLLTGCAAAGGAGHPSKFAAGAQSALDHAKIEKAVSLAEQAVTAEPRNAQYRLLLGNVYMRAGRFVSARQAYDDAMQLGDDSPRTALSLALSDIAVGHYPQAVDTLHTYRDTIPASDYGLALALAGQTSQGVAVLSDVLRGGENTGKVRQNLALAYALDGRWNEARVMASQDVTADKLDDRIREWAMMSRPEDSQKRVASLLGVPVRGDEGQPAALALSTSPTGPASAALGAAQSDGQSAPALAQAASQELPATEQPAAAAAPAPSLNATPSTQLAALDLPPASQQVTAPAPQEPAPEMATPAPAYRVQGAYIPANPMRIQPRTAHTRGAAPAPRTVAIAATPDRSTHLVQLGAFASADGAKRAWRHFARRNPALANYRNVTTQATVNGQQFWRVAAGGFAGASSAQSLCHSVKSRGGACLVLAAPHDLRPVMPFQAQVGNARRK
ncbi:SPOR domain-containing protein [Novosphingobium lentum]|uniref:SPOR domain-containing protein n=1 Tax=Novosphingobium lentum TaxID=145287 RepID=UPI0008378927|nr:SPOR domain-containing protein [Novosphingobium lentum]